MSAIEQTSPIRDQLLDCAKGLKFSTLRTTLSPAMQAAIRENWTHDRFLLSLLRSEKEMRDENRRKVQIRKAGFPQLKYLEDLKRQELPRTVPSCCRNSSRWTLSKTPKILFWREVQEPVKHI